MKSFRSLFIITVFIFSQACNQSADKKVAQHKPSVKSSNIDFKKREARTKKCVYKVAVGHDSLPVVKQLFVINEEGINAYAKPAKTASYVTCVYGEKLYVIGQTTNYYIIGKSNSKFYVGRHDAVEETGIPLNNEALNEAYYKDQFDQPQRFTNIEVSLISKKKYDLMHQNAISYFRPDTQSFKKQQGKFAIKYGRKIEKYIDTKETSYDYKGDFNYLNCYVIEIGSDEAERSLYYLFNKRTGKVRYSFPTLPYPSKDKNRIICVDPMGLEMADVYVYSSEKNIVADYAFGRYKNWLPADTQEMFWGQDGYFYLPVLPKMAYRNKWNNDLCLSEGYNYRYVRVKVTGPTIPEPEIYSEADSLNGN